MPASSHNIDSIDVTFDHRQAVADAGLLLTATLADRLGLEHLADDAVTLGFRPGRKLLTLVHTLVAGGDCIDDVNLLRAGSTSRVLGLRELTALARALETKRPGAAASLREGLEHTLTNRLGVTGSLLKTVESTNPVESMIEIVRHHARRVKRWQHGEMALRWTAAGMLAAQAQFRRVNGYRQLPALLTALEAATQHQPGADSLNQRVAG